MNRILTCLLALALSCSGIAQDPGFPRLKEIADSIVSYKNAKELILSNDMTPGKERYFSREAYDRFFDRYFSQMQYQRDAFTEGNSAALKIDDKASTLNLTLSHKANNLIFSVGTLVNVSDKSGVIFSGDKPTAGTELFGSFSYLMMSQRVLKYQGDHARSNWRKRQQLLDSLELVHVYKNPNMARKLRIDSSKYEAQRLLYAQRINDPDNKIASAYIDSLTAVSDKLYKTKEELKKLDNDAIVVEDAIASITEASDKLEIEKQLQTPGITTFRMTWLTGGVRYRKDNYATYDSVLVFSKRIAEMPFDKWTIATSVNFLWQKTDEWIKWHGRSFISSFYASGSWAFVRGNSYQKLKETNLSLVRSRTQNDSVYEFSKPYKLRDITGKKFITNWIHSPSVTLTPMFGAKQFVGLNLITSGEFQEGYKPAFNLRSGLLFRFKDSENEKSVVNFELFFSFQDLTDTGNSGKSVWQNKQIGVAANVPFEKVFFR